MPLLSLQVSWREGKAGPASGGVERPMPRAKHLSGGSLWGLTEVTTGQGSTGRGPHCPEPLGYHGEQAPRARSVSCSLSWMLKWK